MRHRHLTSCSRTARPRRDFLRAAGALSLWASPGCSTLQALFGRALVDPRVIPKGMRVTGMSLTRLDTVFDVDIENPNPVGLKLAGVDYDLAVEGERLAQGKTQGELDLRAGETVPHNVEVQFPLAKTGAQLLKLLEKTEARYVLDAIFHVGAEDFNVGVPGRFEGVTPLPRPPSIAVRDFRFTQVSRAGLGVEILTGVGNVNIFDLPIDTFRFSITLNGRDIVKSDAVAGQVVPAGGALDIPLAFTFSLDDLGLTVASLVERPTLSWVVDFALEAGEMSLPFHREGTIRLARTEHPRPQRLAARDANGLNGGG